MMKNTILALAAAAAIFASSGSASAQSLDGAYLGVSVGYNHGYADVLTNGVVDSPDHLQANGYALGVVGGYNIHENGLLYGFEADIGTLDHTASYQAGTQTVTSDLMYVASLRARLGADFGGVVPYLTAGVAAGENVLTNEGPTSRIADKSLHLGYTVGVGVEASVSEQVSLKLEYLYTDIANHDSISAGNPVSSTTLGAGHQIHSVRIGANFHF